MLLLADVGPIWAQVCPCLGPRLLLLLLWLSVSSLFFVVVVVAVVVVVVVVVLVFLLLLLLADVGPIWAQVCPCLGPRLAHVAHILA